MSDTIGRITVPDIVRTLDVFPVPPDWGCGFQEQPRIAEHQFQSGNCKITQRFHLGNGRRKFQWFKAAANEQSRQAIRDFWEAHQRGPETFIYAAPNPDGTTTNVEVLFEGEISWSFTSVRTTQISITFVEFIPATAAPSYSLGATQLRFPSSALQTALLAQEQELIPLIRIRVKESAVPDIFLSDRRVTVGGQLYQARLLDWDGISQGISGESDDASFVFGDADRVMLELSKDTNLDRARIEFSLFHVGQRIKLDLWAGEAGAWEKPDQDKFRIPASDGLYELRLPYPTRKITRTCGKVLGDLATCPYVGSLATCDKGFDTPNGCQAHGMAQYFGGQPAHPEGVRIKDNGEGTWGFGRPTITATSIVYDSAYSQVIPEIYTDAELPVKAKLLAGRDESDFFDGLGIVGEGPLGAYARDANGMPKHTLDGQLNHGAEDEYKNGLHNPSDPKSWYGLWESLGSDPTSDPFGLHAITDTPVERTAGTAFVELRRTDPKGIQVSQAQDHSMDVYVLRGLQGWVWTAPGVRSMQLLTNPIWICVNAVLRAKGMRNSSAAACEGVIDIPSAIAAAAICDQTVQVLVGGKDAPDGWAEANDANRYLDSATIGFQASDVGQTVTVVGAGHHGANLITTITGFVNASRVVTAQPALTTVEGARIVVGTGTEKQYRYRGSLSAEKPLSQWIQEILNNCLGYMTHSFGRVRFGMRGDSGAVEAFTDGNIVLGSLKTYRKRPTFNHLTVNFGDEEYGYQANAVSVYDVDQAREASSGSGPQFTKSDLNLSGTFTKSQAARVGATRLREEMGGVTATERKNARKVSFLTTALALNTYAGQVISITGDDMPGGRGEFRILSWRLMKDFSIEIQGETTTDSMYDLISYPGPKPQDVAAAPVPGEPSLGLIPGDVRPIGDQPFLLTLDPDGKLPVFFDATGAPSLLVEGQYDPPAPMGSFSRVAILLDHANGKRETLGTFPYDGTPDGEGDARYGKFRALVRPGNAEDVTIRVVSCSAIYQKPVDANTPLRVVGAPQGAPAGVLTIPPTYEFRTGGGPVANPYLTTSWDYVAKARYWILELAVKLPSVGALTGVCIWLDRGDGRGYQAWDYQHPEGADGTIIVCRIWVPQPLTAETWNLKVLPLTASYRPPATDPTAISLTVLIPQPGPPLANDIRNAYVVCINDAPLKNRYGEDYFEPRIHFETVSNDPNLAAVLITVRTKNAQGQYGGMFPSETQHRMEAAWGQTFDWLNQGEWSPVHPWCGWNYPVGAEKDFPIFEFRAYAQGYDPESLELRTLQTSCWGGQDHADLIPPTGAGEAWPAVTVEASNVTYHYTEPDFFGDQYLEIEFDYRITGICDGLRIDLEIPDATGSVPASVAGQIVAGQSNATASFTPISIGDRPLDGTNHLLIGGLSPVTGNETVRVYLRPYIAGRAADLVPSNRPSATYSFTLAVEPPTGTDLGHEFALPVVPGTPMASVDHYFYDSNGNYMAALKFQFAKQPNDKNWAGVDIWKLVDGKESELLITSAVSPTLLTVPVPVTAEVWGIALVSFDTQGRRNSFKPEITPIQYIIIGAEAGTFDPRKFDPNLVVTLGINANGQLDILPGGVNNDHLNRSGSKRIWIIDADVVSLNGGKLFAGSVSTKQLDTEGLNVGGGGGKPGRVFVFNSSGTLTGFIGTWQSGGETYDTCWFAEGRFGGLGVDNPNILFDRAGNCWIKQATFELEYTENKGTYLEETYIAEINSAYQAARGFARFTGFQVVRKGSNSMHRAVLINRGVVCFSPIGQAVAAINSYNGDSGGGNQGAFWGEVTCYDESGEMSIWLDGHTGLCRAFGGLQVSGGYPVIDGRGKVKSIDGLWGTRKAFQAPRTEVISYVSDIDAEGHPVYGSKTVVVGIDTVNMVFQGGLVIA